ncbi:hypothetical protein NM74_07830 [Aeromonas hydrophila]|uniref:phage GP46 family protein n=1 Tax=Aeromonas hydrophila TaxID=644 RepID=UPI000537A32E|nr:phage GP46 family protein [Aeromonas hydrophila]KHA57126.1 hypothetical protein NM74_07830 [Aeromonas hydrophila]
MDAALVNRYGYFYLHLDGADLADEAGLRTAVTLSLFTDRLALSTDTIPDGTADRRGHWSDSYLSEQGDLEGSRLWLLSREKVVSEVLRRAEDYSREALAWMATDEVVKQIAVSAWTTGVGDMNIRTTLTKQDGANATFEFLDIWNQEVNHAV